MAGYVSSLRRMYLTTYNCAVCAGWFQVLYFTLKTLIQSGQSNVYGAIEKPLLLAQSAALFEILHGTTGLVRSPISAALPQISSRLYVVWGILYSFPEVQTNLFVSSMVISWCVTEIIRYSFFGMKEAFGSAPFWLLWLRYSTFLVLYSGIASEVGLIYNALPYIKGLHGARKLNDVPVYLRGRLSWSIVSNQYRNPDFVQQGCPTNGTFHLITSIVRSWCLDFTYQGSRTYMVICLGRGRNFYANQRLSEKLVDDLFLCT